LFRELPGWTEQEDGRYCCHRCGILIRIGESDPLPIRHACRRNPRHSGPSVARQAINFTVAAVGHLLRGVPTCTQEEIDARLAICRGCPLFDGAICTHRDCGCRVNRRGKFLNKLAWADQACPIKKWNAIDR
jgi:hypothetical protein